MIEIVLSDGTSGTFNNGGEAFVFCQKHRPYWDYSHLRADGREICSMGEFMERNADRRKTAELRVANRERNTKK
jgi:hypothetical protein